MRGDDDYDDEDDDYTFYGKGGSAAENLRDEALERVALNAGIWYGKAIMLLRHLPVGWTGIGEDMRHFVEAKIGLPHHRNVTGALVRHVKKAGLFEGTGVYRKMIDPQSHARKSEVLVRVVKVDNT